MFNQIEENPISLELEELYKRINSSFKNAEDKQELIYANGCEWVKSVIHCYVNETDRRLALNDFGDVLITFLLNSNKLQCKNLLTAIHEVQNYDRFTQNFYLPCHIVDSRSPSHRRLVKTLFDAAEKFTKDPSSKHEKLLTYFNEKCNYNYAIIDRLKARPPLIISMPNSEAHKYITRPTTPIYEKHITWPNMVAKSCLNAIQKISALLPLDTLLAITDQIKSIGYKLISKIETLSSKKSKSSKTALIKKILCPRANKLPVITKAYLMTKRPNSTTNQRIELSR